MISLNCRTLLIFVIYFIWFEICSARSCRDSSHSSRGCSHESSSSHGREEIGKDEEKEPLPEPLPAIDGIDTTWLYVNGIVHFVLFLGTTLRSVWAFYTLAMIKPFPSKHFYVTSNVLVGLGSLSRCVFLIDPFGVLGYISPLISCILFTVITPCIASAFCLLFFALYSSFSIDTVVRDRLRSNKLLVCTILIHFLLKFALDVVLESTDGFWAAFIGCLFMYLLMTAVVTSKFIYMFPKLFAAAKRNQMMVKTVTVSTVVNPQTGQQTYIGKTGLTMKRALKYTLMIAIVNVLLVVNQVYGIIWALHPFSDEQPSFWEWWAYINIRFVLEFLGCAAMLYVVCPKSLRFRRRIARVVRSRIYTISGKKTSRKLSRSTVNTSETVTSIRVCVDRTV